MEELQRQINDINRRLDMAESSSSIPRNLETAMRERLGIDVIRNSIVGRVALSGGTATITDARIKTTSVIVAFADSSAISPVTSEYGTCGAGSATINSSVGDTRTFMYVIFI